MAHNLVGAIHESPVPIARCALSPYRGANGDLRSLDMLHLTVQLDMCPSDTRYGDLRSLDMLHLTVQLDMHPLRVRDIRTACE